MDTQIQMVAREEIDESFLTQIQLWANEVLKMAEFPSPPPLLCIREEITGSQPQDR